MRIWGLSQKVTGQFSILLLQIPQLAKFNQNGHQKFRADCLIMWHHGLKIMDFSVMWFYTMIIIAVGSISFSIYKGFVIFIAPCCATTSPSTPIGCTENCPSIDDVDKMGTDKIANIAGLWSAQEKANERWT